MKALPRTDDWQRKSLFLSTVFVFLALGFLAAPQNAQTKRGAKSAPTPAKKTAAKATPTPKKTAAKTTAAKKNEPQKANAKKADAKKANAKKADPKKDKKQADRDARQAKAKPDAKKSSKPEPKTTAKSKAADKKSKEVPARRTANTREREKPAAKTAARDTRQSTRPAAEPKPPVRRTTRAEFAEIIATVPGVSVRSEASSGAPVVSRVRLGQVLKVSDKNPAWYKVQFANGARTSTGWVSANSVNTFSSAEQDEIFRRIVERNYRPNGMDFLTAAEVYEFLTEKSAVQPLSADIELKRLLALRAALKTIGGNTQTAVQQSFLKKYDDSIVYSEPAGEWLVRSNLFWNLHAKHKSQSIAEQIAWEAAQNPLPGECEGYVNCYLFYMRMTTGEYLNLHPNGKNSAAALSLLTNGLEPIAASLSDKSNTYIGPSDVTDRAEFNNLIAELRTIVSRLPFTEKEKPLRQLKQIAEGFR